MGQVEQDLEIWIDHIGMADQPEQGLLLAAIPLTSLQVGDALPDRFRTAGGSAFGHLPIQRGEFPLLQADCDLSGHSDRVAPRAYRVVCTGCQLAEGREDGPVPVWTPISLSERRSETKPLLIRLSGYGSSSAWAGSQ